MPHIIITSTLNKVVKLFLVSNQISLYFYDLIEQSSNQIDKS